MNYGEVWKDQRDKEVVMVLTEHSVVVLEAPSDPERRGFIRRVDSDDSVNPQSKDRWWERVE